MGIDKMVLESTIICIDNSEYSRNGDSNPTRLWAQRDAANFIARGKLRDNPENDVGIVQMNNHNVIASLTSDTGRLNTVLSKIVSDGSVSLNTSIRVAQLALKHRMNKNHKQRIVIFICSPLEAEMELVKTAKRLKKEKINVDLISFGECEFNQTRLDGFNKALNSDGSSFLNVESDDLMAAMRGSSIPADDFGPSTGAANDFGGVDDIDPEMDPELAMALRMSLEEERARQERLQEEEAAVKVEEEARQENNRNNVTIEVTHTEEMSQEIADLMMNNVGVFARKNSRIHHVSEAEEIEDEEDQAALMKALELSMAQPELEQGMSHDYESLGLIEERHLKSDTYWIHTLDNGQVFEVTPPDEEADGVIDEELLNQIMQGLPGVNISEVRKNMEDKDKDKK